MATFVIAAAAGGYFVLQPAGAALDRRDQMLGGGGVELVVELDRAPHAQIPIALENGLHALPAVHLAGFLVIHGDVRVRALASAGGALAHMGACAGRGQNITIHL